jgi:predicted nucleic acid-binding protein
VNVVDSSGWLEYFADTKRAKFFAAAIDDPATLVVPVISIYEVFKRVLRDAGEGKALQIVSVMMNGQVVELDSSLALEAAHLKMPLADSIIYATALRHKAALWTQDEDFKGLPNVRYFAK